MEFQNFSYFKVLPLLFRINIQNKSWIQILNLYLCRWLIFFFFSLLVKYPKGERENRPAILFCCHLIKFCKYWQLPPTPTPFHYCCVTLLTTSLDVGLYNIRFLRVLRDLSAHTVGPEYRLAMYFCCCFEGSDQNSDQHQKIIWSLYTSPWMSQGSRAAGWLARQPTGNLCGQTLGSSDGKAAYQEAWEKHSEPASPSWERHLESHIVHLLP